MAVVNYWDGSVIPSLSGAVPSSVTIEAGDGRPAPSLSFVTSSVAYHPLPSSPAPQSIRMSLRMPSGNAEGCQLLRFQNIVISLTVAGSLRATFTGASNPADITVVGTGAWVTIEVNLSSAASGRCRFWLGDVLVYDRTSTFTARSGGYFGSGTPGGVTGNTYLLDEITITDTADDIVPVDPPDPPAGRALRAFDGAAWATGVTKVQVGGAWVEPPIRLYGDPEWPYTEPDAIDAATSVPEIQAVLTALGTDYGVGVSITSGSVSGGSFVSTTTIDDGYIQTAAKALVAAVRRYPESLFASGGWKFHIGRTLMVGGKEVSGVYGVGAKTMAMNTDATDTQLAMIADRYASGIFITHHESAHGFWEQMTGTALTTFKSEMAAAQPPGHTWGTQDDPFAGEHPVGFCRWYGRTNADEDQADIVGWVLTEALWERDAQWFVDDPYLAAKAAAARKWLTSLGFTGL